MTMLPNETCVVCGFRLRGFHVGTYRINKCSLKSARGGLTFVEPKCAECGHPTPHALDITHWRLDPDSQRIVDECRARKGWN